MGRYPDVDHLGESDMDTAILVVGGIVGVALSQTRTYKRDVAATRASMCGDDSGDRIGSGCCGFHCLGDTEGARCAPAPYARA